LGRSCFGTPDTGDTSLEAPSEVDAGQELPVEAAPTLRQDFTPPPRSTEEQTWLVMLYQDADDKILEEDIYLDLNEAERIGSNERMHIVAQVDRFQGGFSGESNWTSVKRLYVTKDDDLQQVHSLCADLRDQHG
jgi:hypothetical protein